MLLSNLYRALGGMGWDGICLITAQWYGAGFAFSLDYNSVQTETPEISRAYASLRKERNTHRPFLSSSHLPLLALVVQSVLRDAA